MRFNLVGCIVLETAWTSLLRMIQKQMLSSQASYGFMLRSVPLRLWSATALWLRLLALNIGGWQMEHWDVLWLYYVSAEQAALDVDRVSWTPRKFATCYINPNWSQLIPADRHWSIMNHHPPNIQIPHPKNDDLETYRTYSPNACKGFALAKVGISPIWRQLWSYPPSAGSRGVESLLCLLYTKMRGLVLGLGLKSAIRWHNSRLFGHTIVVPHCFIGPSLLTKVWQWGKKGLAIFRYPWWSWKLATVTNSPCIFFGGGLLRRNEL